MPFDTAPQTAHPNKSAMDAAISGWISAARLRADGAKLLRVKADYLDQQNGELFRYASRDQEPPKHLVGLTTYDLLEGQWKIEAAVREIEGVGQ